MLRLLTAASVAVIAAGGSPADAAGVSRFEQLRQQDLRVAAVAYRLSTADLRRCRARPTPQLGFAIHGLAQYAPADRQAVAAAFGLGQGIAVMAVVPGSPADRAGLTADDRLVSVNGIALTAPAEAAPSREAVDEAAKVIADEMAKGTIVLHVSRGGDSRVVRFDAAAGCSSRAELVLADDVNAWADGERIVITRATLERCRTDDELALVIAHEMAHNILGHRRRLGLTAVGAALLPATASGSAAMRRTEEEADRFAIGMMSTAGYDLRQAAPFLARLLQAEDPSSRFATTHPTSARRLALLTAAIARTDAAARSAQPGTRIAGNTSARVRVSGRM